MDSHPKNLPSIISSETDLEQCMTTSRSLAKLPELTDKEIYITLGYCIMLVGLRPQNYPGDTEKQLLAEYLRNHFPYTTAMDIRLAFEFAISGKLSLPDSEIKPYENFSCLYVSIILRAYKEYFNSIIQSKSLSTGLKTLPPPNYDPTEFINMYYQEFLTDKLNIKFISTKAFETAVLKCGLLVYEDEFEVFLQRAKKEILIEDLHTRLEQSFDQAIEDRAKVLCLVNWFDEQKKKGIKVISQHQQKIS